jgi:hypothetical protein
MATSGSYNFTATRDEIIDSALRKAAGLGDWESASETQKTKAAFLLNSIIKSYHQIGMPVWAHTVLEIPCINFDTEGKVTIGIGEIINSPKPLKVTQCFLEIDGSYRELYITDRQTFHSFAHNGSLGTPTAVYYQPERNTGDLYVYQRPDTYHQTNASLFLHHQTTLQDVDTSADELDFPVEWVLLLIYELACHIAPDYGLPLGERNLLEMTRARLKKESLDFDVDEGSIYIQP